MGAEERALAQARANVDAWTREIEGEGLEAIVVTASGCGATIKDYGHMLRDDPAYAEKAERVASLAKDVSEIAAGSTSTSRRRACSSSLITQPARCSTPRRLSIRRRLCCAAPVSRCAPSPRRICAAARRELTTSCNPKSPRQLRDRKVANIARVKPDVIAAGNIGCITQIGSATATPVVHMVELLDWASGGPAPGALA